MHEHVGLAIDQDGYQPHRAFFLRAFFLRR